MTDGSSQGLFVIVAVVIFGIFVAIAYTLFEDTLSPALASMFHDATEQASKNLNDKGILLQKDPEFSNASLYITRNGVMTNVDLDTTYLSKPSLKAVFTRSQELTYLGDGHDFRINFSSNDNILDVGDTILLEFYAKSDTPVNLSTRLGGGNFKGTIIQSPIVNEWERYTIEMEITHLNPHTSTSIVFYVDNPSTIWFSDYTIKLINK